MRDQSNTSGISKLGIALPPSIVNDDNISLLFSFSYIVTLLLLPGCTGTWWLWRQARTESGLSVVTIHQLFLKAALRDDTAMDISSILKIISDCSQTVTKMDRNQSLALKEEKRIRTHLIFSFFREINLDIGSDSFVFFLI
jgi:preprotein translocase subunit Sec63